jgi:peptidoglycan hydrolase-like protein with peptidoglycan-binding domain
MTDETLERGSEGPAVSDLQERLIAERFKPGEVDGIFGVITESAVKMFQVAVRLEADGIVGPLTWEKLHAAAEHQAEGAETEGAAG